MSMKHPQKYHDRAAKFRRRNKARLKQQRHERRIRLAGGASQTPPAAQS